MSELSFTLAVGLTVKIYALLTPTAVLGAFISHCDQLTSAEKRSLAIRTGIAIYLIGQFLLIFGSSLFSLFGFTLDAFRIGVGVLLFLSAVELMNEKPGKVSHSGDISVVPLAIPLGMGPATIGTVMVYGASAGSAAEIIVISICLLIASAGISALLIAADRVRKAIGRTGILVMSKLTALILSAMAAQVIFTGIKAFLSPG